MDYRTKEELLAQARAYLDAGNGAVSIDTDRVQQVAGTFAIPDRLPDWKDYLSAEAQQPYNVVRAAFELALNASQNAGYTEPDGQGGVSKWEIKGSGSSALKAFFRELRDKKRLPGIDLNVQQVESEIAPMLDGQVITPDLKGRKVPFARERLDMFKEFATPGAMQVFERIVENAKTENGYAFTFENTVLPLREHFPKSFGDDPLAKKALLMPILLTANAQAHGVNASTDVLLPADYRLPVTLNKLGILHFNDELLQAINGNTLWDQNDPRLLAVRGATLLACDALCRQAGLQPQQLDAALWSAAAPKTPEQQSSSFVDRLLQRPPNSHGLWI